MTSSRRSLPGVRTLLVALAIATSAARCSGGSGGGGSSDGAAGLGAGGGVGLGGSGGAAACNVPSCLLDVITSCVPQGSCKTQISGNAFTICYANGVSQIGSFDFMSNTSTLRVTKPDGSTCWSYDMPVGATLPEKLVVDYKDGTGRTFATLTYDTTTGEVAVACPGSPPQSLRGACAGAMMPMMSGGSSAGPAMDACSTGTCP